MPSVHLEDTIWWITKQQLHENKIFLHENGRNKCVATFDFVISGIALSCDKSLLYVCSIDNRFILAFRIYEDGSLHDMYHFARLHIADHAEYVGASSICVDEHDRLYAATALGIQTFSWEGHCNCILPLPDKEVPMLIGFLDKEPNKLYAISAQKHFYSREVLTRGATGDAASQPGTPLF
ncbi:MAG: hypothetical protein IKP58_12550 [Victivallales bacterium]|nr:hypothetical protein [Victivallales bacterium]